jgi:hypothetical protein
MRYAITLPNIDYDAQVIADLAVEAEEAGWDGVFAWDCVNMGNRSTHDPWMLLAAIAARTHRIRLGTLITPLSRRRPWKVARETVTLDHLSNGRFILPVGLGEPGDGGFSKVGEEVDRKKRAQMLDESLDIITGLWSGKPFSYNGEHYHVEEMTFLPEPAQTPRIPVWVVGAWPRKKSMQRTLRYDGILPSKMNDDGSFADMTPDDLRAMKVFIDEQRTLPTPFDIVIEGETPGDNVEKAAAIVQPLADAGVTWWLEAVWRTPESESGAQGMRRRIMQGPPRVG